MHINQNWFLAERTEQLATLYLTRRDDLAVIRQSNDATTDLLVSVKKNGRDIGRYFAVEVKGLMQSNDKEVKFNPNWVDEASLQDIPYPVCLFVFKMEDDSGYWKWLREPLPFSTQGGLKMNNSDQLKRLDNTKPSSTIELANIIDTINSWYDSRQSRQMTATV